jgi:mannose-6-phosphate isomerase-like protein (cupin superfamily)
VLAGGGQMWRASAAAEAVTGLVPGLCLTIPLGTAFQFRAGPDGLRVVAVTIPPWPDQPGEARQERGPWKASPGV